MIGTNDTNPNNILKIDGQFYSIDDPALDQDTPYIFKIKRKFDNLPMTQINEIINQWCQLEIPDSYKRRL